MYPHLQSDQPPAREGTVPVASTALYYRDIGQGPPIILLHGGPDFDHNYFLPDMDRLASDYRLIYYDQRGRGQSAANVRPEDVSLLSEIDDLERVREYFQLEQAAVLGHSFGGILAMEYAIRHPDRVSRLILMNPAPASHDDYLLLREQRRASAPEDVELLRELASRPGYADGDVAADLAYYRVHFRSTLRPPELRERLIEHLRVGASSEGILKARAIEDRLNDDTWVSSDYDLLPRLTQLRIPTLVIYGEYDLVPFECVAHIVQAIPGARFVVLRGCGHFTFIERPDEVRSALSEFFQAT